MTTVHTLTRAFKPTVLAGAATLFLAACGSIKPVPLTPSEVSARVKADKVESYDLTAASKGRRVVVFALPGAYTPTCSSQHVPRFNELAPDLKRAGVANEIVRVRDGQEALDYLRGEGAFAERRPDATVHCGA